MSKRVILNETAYFGKGAIKNIVKEAKARKFKKALVVTDKALIEYQVATKVINLLKENGLDYEVFDGIEPNPSMDVVQKGLAVFKKSGADYLLAVGGGSSIDTAKAIGIIIMNPNFSDIRSLEGFPETENPSIPIFAVPTTSGTAAEVTINYVITDKENQRKFASVDPHDIPVASFVDSELMMGMPASLAAATGMDAMTHAIEGYITKNAWTMTDMFHINAIEMIGRSLKASVEGDAEAREELALAQYVAGMGFSNAGLGLVHGMAHPLSAWYNIPHGVACAALLPTVMDFNKDAAGEKYREIARVLGSKDVSNLATEEAAKEAVALVAQLSKEVGIPEHLVDLGVKEKDLNKIAEDALIDVNTAGNPKEVTLQEIVSLYRSCL